MNDIKIFNVLFIIYLLINIINESMFLNYCNKHSHFNMIF